MGSFRSIIVEIFLGLSLIVITCMAIMSIRRFGIALLTGLKTGLAKRRRQQTMRRVDELLERFDSKRLERIALECWRRDCCRTHEIYLRSKHRDADKVVSCEFIQKSAEQKQETIDDCRMKLMKMDREELLRVISIFLEEQADRKMDPYELIIDAVGATEDDEHDATR